ncbi:polyphenol oxidase, partial [Trifolium medium]|nr:polyphenol oxidase [Trifolium medium]
IDYKPIIGSRVKSKDKNKFPSRKFVEKFPIVLDSVVSTTVNRLKKSRSSKEKEILVIYGIEFDDDMEVKFDE